MMRRLTVVCLVGLTCVADTPANNAIPDLPPPKRSENRIDFSFDQVDVGTFVKLIGEITGRRIVLGDGVQGRITVVSPRVTRDEVYPLFVSILQSIGCSVMEDGDVSRVVALPARDAPIAPVVGAEETAPANGVFTKIFRLEHVSAGELHKALQAQIGGGKAGAIAAIE
jgi:type II secretory pathway component GspD/PulD (secretin)